MECYLEMAFNVTTLCCLRNKSSKSLYQDYTALLVHFARFQFDSKFVNYFYFKYW